MTKVHIFSGLVLGVLLAQQATAGPSAEAVADGVLSELALNRQTRTLCKAQFGKADQAAIDAAFVNWRDRNDAVLTAAQDWLATQAPAIQVDKRDAHQAFAEELLASLAGEEARRYCGRWVDSVSDEGRDYAARYPGYLPVLEK